MSKSSGEKESGKKKSGKKKSGKKKSGAKGAEGVALFIFRRDFRIAGNPAWNRCVRWCRERGCPACPCFVFSDRQIDPARNPYFSPPAYAFMRAALSELDSELGGRLSLFRVRGGLPDTALLDDLAGGRPVLAVFFNSDVTPFAVDRDAGIREWCRERGAHCGAGRAGEGYTFWPAGSVRTKSGDTVPKSFSAFYRYTAGREAPSEPSVRGMPDIRKIEAGPGFEATGLPDPVPVPESPSAEAALAAVRGGRFDRYGETRDDYALPTTRLSAHLKFGRVDPARALGAARERGVRELERQLLWREYYYHLAHGYPEILTAPNRHIRPDRQRVRWSPPDRRLASRWLEGETGEPLVDQAMRELARTGYLHNRLRMVVSSYFTKDLGMDWREGERLLATRLVDYDPAQNSGGWQSADAQLRGQSIKASTQMKRFGSVPPSPAPAARRPGKG